MNETENQMPSVSYLPVEFFTKQEKFGSTIPTEPFSVPSSATHLDLNDLLHKFSTDSATDDASADYDFLIDGVLLRVSLDEFVLDQQLSSESVLKIECVLREPTPEPRLNIEHDDWVSAVRTQNRCLVSGSYNNSVYVWSHEGEPLATGALHSGAIKALAVVPIDKDESHFNFVSASHDQTMMLWNYEFGRSRLSCTHVFRGHERSVECVCVNQDGSRLASGSFDSFLKIWNTSVDSDQDAGAGEMSTKKRKTTGSSVISKTPMVTLSGHREAVTAVAWSPHTAAEAVTSSFDHTIVIWDLELAGQKSFLSSNKSFTSLAISPISGLFITGSVDKFVRLWDQRSKEGAMVKSTFMSHNGWVSCVDWSKTNEQLFISGSYDGLLKMWDIRSPKAPLYDMSGHEDRILACDWSIEKMMLSASVDNTLKSYVK